MFLRNDMQLQTSDHELTSFSGRDPRDAVLLLVCDADNKHCHHENDDHRADHADDDQSTFRQTEITKLELF